jgi:N-acetylglucosaminyl-diphospho-decaprenol L-rhamnosyltransferase
LTDVSIIIIAHNVRDEVHTCLRSIVTHRGALEVETIVVDNGSQDATVESVQEQFPGTTVIALSRNEGGSARNHGLRVARGRHRMFLDSDAQLTAGALQDLTTFMDDNPQIGLVGPGLVYTDGSMQPSARRFPPLTLPLLRRPPLSRWCENGETVRRHLMLDVPTDFTRETEYVIGACQMFSAEAQLAAGELDPRIPFAPEDIDWCLSIRRAGYRIAYRPEATVIHAYRRATARGPLSRAALMHLYGFAYFQWKWRHARAGLRAEALAMEARGWALPLAKPAANM